MDAAWTRRFSVKILSFFSAFLLLCSCSHLTDSPKGTTWVSPDEERLSDLEDRIDKQQREIDQLKRELKSSINRKVAQISVRKNRHKHSVHARTMTVPQPALDAEASQPTPRADSDADKVQETDPALSLQRQTPPADPFAAEANLLDQSKAIDKASDTIADSSQEAMHDYYLGLQYRKDHNFEQAINSFRRFVTQNPTHIYADRAQFLIADSQFQNKDYGLAVMATNFLEARYPYSVKLPQALFERGVAYQKLGQDMKAKQTFQTLLRSYPSDPFALRAKGELARLARLQSGEFAPPLLGEMN